MNESLTYQANFNAGRVKEARKILLLQGRIRFGEPSPEVLAALDALTDIEQLEELALRIFDVRSWKEFPALNPPRSRARRRTWTF